jgi:hypothetical protein
MGGRSRSIYFFAARDFILTVGAGSAKIPPTWRQPLKIHSQKIQSPQSDGASCQLEKDAEQAGDALVELGPDLIRVFLPITGLAPKASAFIAKKAGWVKKLEQPKSEFGLAKSQRLGDLRLMLIIRDRRFLRFHIRQQ